MNKASQTVRGYDSDFGCDQNLSNKLQLRQPILSTPYESWVHVLRDVWIYQTMTAFVRGEKHMSKNSLHIPHKFYVLGQIGLSKQCRPRSDCF